MSSVTKVVAAAAVAMGLGGAVTAFTLAESNEPPAVGDPVVIERPREPAMTTPSRSANGETPTGDGRRPSRDDRDADLSENESGDGSGVVVDDDVVEVRPNPQTLDDDGGDNDDGDDDGGDDEDDDGDDD